MTPSVVLVPFPITPLVAFAFFLLRRLGTISFNVHVRYYVTPPEAAKEPLPDNEAVVNLAARDLYARTWRWMAEAQWEGRSAWARLISFSNEGDQVSGNHFRRWLLRCSLAFENPFHVLEAADARLTRCLEGKIDPWHTNMFVDMPSLPTPRAYPAVRPRFVQLPVFASGEYHETKLKGYTQKPICENEVFHLEAAHLGIAIFGPPNSGKSTFWISLTAEIERKIAALRAKTGWPELILTAKGVDLDLGTPAGTAIREGLGQDRMLVAGLKSPWSKSLALDALQNFLEAKAEAEVVVADLPGKVTELTEIIASAADVAILVARDWSQIGEWRKFVRHRMGLLPVVEARSLPRGGGVISAVLRYREGKDLMGRIVGLERDRLLDDPFISWTADFLLFDILPSLIKGRRNRLLHELKSLTQ